MKIKNRRTKPTNYQAAKAVILIQEEFTAAAIVDRLLSAGRREVPTKRSLAAKFKKDKDFIVVRKNGSSGPTIFKRVQ